MASCINTCKVKANELLKDLLPSDSHDLLWFSLGLSLSNQAVILPHLVDVNLNEILFRILAYCQPCIENLVDDLANLHIQVEEVLILFGKVNSRHFFSKEEGPEEVGSAS